MAWSCGDVDTTSSRPFLLPCLIPAATHPPRLGVDRTFLAIFSLALKDETLPDGSVRTLLSLPPVLAPYKAAILPLVKKDGLPEKAREIMDMLKFDFACRYDEKDSVGKRYRRMDAIGTPTCITIVGQTVDDNSVTLRDRDTMEQQRVPIAELRALIDSKVNLNNLLRKL